MLNRFATNLNDAAVDAFGKLHLTKSWSVVGALQHYWTPQIRSAVFAGTLLTFSRCLGEIGSVILVSGNRTGHTLTAPVFIFSLTSQFRFAEAAAVATFLFAISFVLVLATGKLVKQREESG